MTRLTDLPVFSSVGSAPYFTGVDKSTPIGVSGNYPGSLVGKWILSQPLYSAPGSKTSRTLNSKLSESASVADYGAVGDGVTDDTLAIRNAFANAKNIVFPPNLVFKVTNTLTVYGRQKVDGNNSTINYVGSNDLFWIKNGGPWGGDDLIQMRSLNINGAGMTGGYLFRTTLVGRVSFYDIQASGYNGIIIEGCNNITGYNFNLAAVVGPYGYVIDGTVYRTDLVSFWGSGAACPNILSGTSLADTTVGVYAVGNANSLNFRNCQFIGMKQGVLSQSAVVDGLTYSPYGIILDTVAVDHTSRENYRFEAGSILQLNNCFGVAADFLTNTTYNTGYRTIYFGSGCQYVQVSGGSFSSAQAEIMYIGGTEVTVGAGAQLLSFTALPLAGKYATIRVASTAKNVNVNNTILGSRTGIGPFNSYVAQIDNGAQKVSFTGNTCSFLVEPWLNNAAAGEFTFTGNSGIYGYQDRFVRVTNFAGSDFQATATIGSGGAISGWTVDKPGIGFWTTPAAVYVVGDGPQNGGTAATATVAINGLGGLTVSGFTGGTAYTFATLAVVPASSYPGIRPGDVAPGVGADFLVSGAGGGSVDVRNDFSIGLRVTGVSNGVNYLNSVGATTGNVPSIGAVGSDANIGINLLPKGTGKVGISGPLQFTSPSAGGVAIPATAAGYLLLNLAGTTRYVPFF